MAILANDLSIQTEKVISSTGMTARLRPLKDKGLKYIELEKKVKFPLQGSNPDPESLNALFSLEPNLEQQLKALRLDYTDPSGLLDLRREIADLYDTIDEDDVIVLSGAESILYFLCQTILKPWDHVIVQHPCYLPAVEMLANCGCSISFWECNAEDNWSVRLDDLEDLLQPNTRCISTNSPHNPTGYSLSDEQKQELTQFCETNELFWISDEVYGGIEPDGQQCTSACDLSMLGMSIGSLSKTMGLPGLRIGWLATRDSELRKQISDHAATASLCMSPLTQLLAATALQKRGFFLQKNRALMQANRSLVDDFINAHANYLEWTPPEAGTVAFPRLYHKLTAEEFCLDLAAKQGVLFLPGNLFLAQEKHFRINLMRENLADALEPWATYMKHC